MLNLEVKEQKNNTVRTLLFITLLMVVVGVFFFSDMEKIKIFIVQAGAWGLLISIACYALLGLTPVPSEPLTILIGGMFGPLVATIVSGIGNILSAIVEYYLGKKIGQATNFMSKKEKLPFGLGKMPVNSIAFLMGARALPGYGPKFVSVIAGIYHVSMPRYIVTTAITTLIGSAIFAFGGFGLSKLF
ncbi:MAG: TVP38/TMEM64 family protein [Anaerolineaceae bacterium]|nr:TVP38/TMEM64 family protein [Anaerolineaceae bacterium]NTV35538.1 TVP38/TMEM64 family protein [Anaerolineaceae bacterium]